MKGTKSHKVLKIVGVLVLLLIIGAVAESGKQTTKTVSQNAPAVPQSTATTQPAATPAKPAFDGAAFYDKVQTGMSKAQVVATAGKDPSNCSESQTQGVGKFEYCTWYDGSFSSKSISVTFENDQVYDKSKYGY